MQIAESYASGQLVHSGHDVFCHLLIKTIVLYYLLFSRSRLKFATAAISFITF